MQLAEPAEHPCGFVAKVAVVRRTVVLLGDPDVTHPVEDALDADPALDARQWSAGTRVVPAAERDVRLHVDAVDAELLGALETAGGAGRGAGSQDHPRTRRDVDTADRGGAPGETEVGLDRALHPEHLFEEARDAV